MSADKPATKTILLSFDIEADDEEQLPRQNALQALIGEWLPDEVSDLYRVSYVRTPPQPAPPPDNSRCPACGHLTDGRELNRPRPLRRIRPHACLECDATWHEVYEFARVEMITTPTPTHGQKRQALQDAGIVGPKPGEEPGPLSEESIRKARG